MEYTHYIRRPFEVDAVEITEDNMAEIAKLVGEIKTKDGVTFIQLDRRVIPNVTRALVGWYLTKLDANYRCYSPNIFHEQFMPHESEITFAFEASADAEETQGIIEI